MGDAVLELVFEGGLQRVVGIRAKSLNATPFTLKYVQTLHTPVGAKGNIDGASKPLPNWIFYESEFGPQGLLDRYGSPSLRPAGSKEGSGIFKTIGNGLFTLMGSGKFGKEDSRGKNKSLATQRLGLSRQVDDRVFEVTERQSAQRLEEDKARANKERVAAQRHHEEIRAKRNATRKKAEDEAQQRVKVIILLSPDCRRIVELEL